MAINEANAAAECLYSTVRNIAGTEKYFGFLPPHGRRLASGEEITVFGSIQGHLTKLTPNERARRSLEAALDDTDQAAPASLALVNGPAVHLYDETTQETKILTLDNGTFTAADPCWGTYSSSDVAVN